MIKIYSTDKLTKSDIDTLLASVIQISLKHKGIQTRLIQKYEACSGPNRDIEREINENQSVWKRKVEALGANPKHFFEVSFTTNEGTYNWKPGQTTVTKNTTKQRKVK